MLDKNKNYAFVRYHYDACFQLCSQDNQIPFMNVKETLCFRNCFTKTNACYKAVMDNLENSGAAYYRGLNEKLATKQNSKFAQQLANHEISSAYLDERVGVKLSQAATTQSLF